ncbi:hypothetical protein EYF80_035330 [Liparis tanakae]|uniref:Uncharacterized protein n=1 Tax=Liparis tanakae TaxID=230148 RepID=A0A4Z2GMH2_9TELE|nr:hypothetical protein EYF80_035330 [Liparis tanakae]
MESQNVTGPTQSCLLCGCGPVGVIRHGNAHAADSRGDTAPGVAVAAAADETVSGRHGSDEAEFHPPVFSPSFSVLSIPAAPGLLHCS